MTMLLRALALILLLGAAPVRADPAPVILISIDGFRADYLDRGASPNLLALAATGVRAQRMIPSFPSVTFPNHTALVTGRYPDHNGIINNGFTDPALPGRFSMASQEPAWWGQSTPIWITAERAGVHSGVMFWPGVAVPHDGITPSLFHDFDHAITPAARVDSLLGWLDLPAARRPRLMLMYFEAVDGAGHSFGPDSPQVNQAIAAVDAAIGRLIAGLQARGITANIVIVADHGMAPVGDGQALALDDLIDVSAVRVEFGGTILGIRIPATPAAAAARRTLLANPPHLRCWDKAAIPADLHYGSNPRVPDVVCQVETGWVVQTRDEFQRERTAHPDGLHGAHGYDIHDPLMGALFLANGPAFRAAVTLAPFPNVAVYPLLARLIAVAALPNDGQLSDVAGALRP